MSQTQGLKAFASGVSMGRPTLAWRGALLALGLGLLAQPGAWAQQQQPVAATPPSAPASVPTIPEPPKPPVQNSYLDGPLLYKLLLAEFAHNESQPADAIELMLEAARQTKDDQLFRRAVEIAVEAGAGDKALSVTKTWRQTNPKSNDAVRTQVQLLFALDRASETAEPLKQLLAMSSPNERSALIASLPRAAQRAKDKAAAAEQFRLLLQPYLEAPDTRTAARTALGRMRLAEGKPAAALELAAAAQAQDPTAIGPVLLALDVMNSSAEGTPARAARPAPAASAAKGGDGQNLVAGAEVIVRRYLAEPAAEPLVRQAFAGVLASQQRLTDAGEQLRLAAQARPDQPQLWLGLGEVELELRHPDEADAALRKALALITNDEAQRAAGEKAVAAATDDDDDDDGDAPASAGKPVAAKNPISASHVQLLLARAAEQRHDDAAAAQWLARIDPKDVDLQVVALRATILARQGKLAEARALVHAAPAATPAEERYRLLTEVQLLLDAKKLEDARKLLADANAAAPDDVDLLYQEAMVDERLNRLDDMERLLRRILVLQPNNSQALNALGYSLADRNLRLEEALGLVRQAHELSPADPFIVDSLGWVLYRLGRYGEAATLLNQAYASRRDAEIAAHLGEALWADGKRDEAAQVLRDAARRDAANEVLKQTMARLKVTP
jgi:tetratricopeptide (TPR) repeat protein